MGDIIGNCMLDAIYLHGFASGPSSSKALFFANKLNDAGIQTTVPDLNFPNFESMTLTSQLAVLTQTIDSIPGDRRFVMIGSSMGGLLAAMKYGYAENLAGLILLAPGFGLAKRWPDLFGEATLQSWKEKGSIDVFNYAAGKNLPLSYTFFEDINTHRTEDLRVTVPTLVFHGKLDATVPISESEYFADKNSRYVQLHVLDDDHQLLSSLEHMWLHSKQFLSSLQV